MATTTARAASASVGIPTTSRSRQEAEAIFSARLRRFTPARISWEAPGCAGRWTPDPADSPAIDRQMAANLEKPRWRRWLRRLVVAGVVTTTLIAVVGFLVAPPIARRVAERQLSELLGRKVTIGRIRLNPFALSVEVDAFQIAEADQVTPFVGF